MLSHMQQRILPLIATSLFFLFAAPALAHLADGIDVRSGAYLIDMGWSEKVLAAREPITFAFNLVDPKLSQAVAYDNVFVRLSSGNSVAFAGEFRPEAKNVTFTTTFADAGTYDVLARFKDAQGKVLAETSVPLRVIAQTQSAPAPDDASVAIVASAAVLALLWFGVAPAKPTVVH